MSGLRKKLEKLAQENDGGKLLTELSPLLEKKEIHNIFSGNKSVEQKHIRPLLDQILITLTHYIESLEQDKQDSEAALDAAQKLSEACLAYNKTKTER